MKKFYFALDTVLNYKEQVLENLQAEHAQIIAERVECERGIEALEQERPKSPLACGAPPGAGTAGMYGRAGGKEELRYQHYGYADL